MTIGFVVHQADSTTDLGGASLAGWSDFIAYARDLAGLRQTWLGRWVETSEGADFSDTFRAFLRNPSVPNGFHFYADDCAALRPDLLHVALHASIYQLDRVSDLALTLAWGTLQVTEEEDCLAGW